MRSLVRALAALAAALLAGSSAVAAASPALATVATLPAAARPAGVPADYVVTPAGFFHAACVVRLAAGESVLESGDVERADRSVRRVAACTHDSFSRDGVRRGPEAAGVELRDATAPADAFSGWLAYSQSNPSVTPAASFMAADWVVPAAPRTKADQVLYYFPGLEAVPGTVTILQPVLGWNSYGTGKWTMANWNCCKSGTVYTDNPIAVRAGDQIHGEMAGTTCKKKTPCKAWAITSRDVTTGQSTTFRTKAYGQVFDWYFGGVMEVYGVSSCTMFPASGHIDFVNVVVDDFKGAVVTPAWTGSVSNGAPACSYAVNATTNATSITWAAN